MKTKTKGAWTLDAGEIAQLTTLQCVEDRYVHVHMHSTKWVEKPLVWMRESGCETQNEPDG